MIFQVAVREVPRPLLSSTLYLEIVLITETDTEYWEVIQ